MKQKWPRSSRCWFAVVLVAFLSLPRLAFGQDTAQGQETAAGDKSTIAQHAEALATILRDEAAREALIEDLLAVARSEQAEAPAAVELAPPGDEISVARQVAQYTRDLAQSASDAGTNLQAWFLELKSLVAARGLEDLQFLWEAAAALTLVVAATVVLFFLLGYLARRSYSWLASYAADRGSLCKALLLILSSSIDAIVVVLAWAGGYLVALNFFGQAGQMDIRQTMYLNAFLLVELIKVAFRGVLAPRFGELRLLPMPDLTATYWYFWVGRITALLGYGLLLVVPIVGFNVSRGLGHTTRVLITFLALVMSIAVVLQNREAVRDTLNRRAEAAFGTYVARLLTFLGRVWHAVAIVYLVGLFVIYVSRPEGGLTFALQATGESLLVIAAGVLLTAVISRALTGGMHLPDEIKQRLPLLETRLNAFIPSILRVVRLLFLVGVVLMVAQAWGLFDFLAWAASAGGQDVVGRATGVALILIGAVLIWLALASWIDYRLNPDVGKVPGPRERTLLALLRNAMSIVIVVFTLMWVLAEVGINIAPLLAGAGVLGLAIGFGAQKLVQDIITGIFIQFENAINEGDVVTAAGLTGVVEKLTIRSVGLRDLQGVYHIIPFSSVDSVSNFMRGFGYHVAEIGIAYRENIDEAKGLMHRAFEELAADPEHGAAIVGPLEWHGLTQFGDSAIVLRARIKTRPGNQWAVGRAYNAIIKRLFDEHGIEIPFPHVTVYFGEGKDGTAAPARLQIEESGSVLMPAGRKSARG